MRIYRFRDLRGAGVPFTRKHVRTLELLDQFPRRVAFGASTVAWVADEVDAWVEEKIRDRRPLPPRQGFSVYTSTTLPAQAGA
jgi:prophage regulatory protein